MATGQRSAAAQRAADDSLSGRMSRAVEEAKAGYTAVSRALSEMSRVANMAGQPFAMGSISMLQQVTADLYGNLDGMGDAFEILLAEPEPEPRPRRTWSGRRGR